MIRQTQIFLVAFVALVVAVSLKTLASELAHPSVHAIIAASEILAALLLLPRQSAALGGFVLAAICLGVALLHLIAGQVRFDLLIYASAALYLGLIPRVTPGTSARRPS
jgi:hypothetical protein